MRSLDTQSIQLSRRLASGFHQHVAIALMACLLGLLLS